MSISGLVAKRVKLRRAGRDLKGLCPFHDEKTPSFVVSDVKRNYHCYGCGAHGDIFDWMVAFDGCTKGEAIRMLAEGGDVVAAAPAARREGFGKARAEVALVDSGVVAAWLWRNRLPAIGSIVEAYCASRGLSIDGPFGREALSRLGFHPRAPVVAWPEGGDVAQAKVRPPCWPRWSRMVACAGCMRRICGPMVGARLRCPVAGLRAKCGACWAGARCGCRGVPARARCP